MGRRSRYVYILRDKYGKVYIGSTKDLKKRIKEHLQGKTITTKKMSKPELYYYEAYTTDEMARVREKKLKQFGSSYHGLIKRIGLNKK